MKFYLFFILFSIVYQQAIKCIEPNIQYSTTTMNFCSGKNRNYLLDSSKTQNFYQTKDQQVQNEYNSKLDSILKQLKDEDAKVGCKTNYAQYLCLQNFPECKSNEIIPICVDYCLLYHTSCGFLKQNYSGICGTQLSPKDPFKKGHCSTSESIQGRSIVIICFCILFFSSCFLFSVCTFMGNAQFIWFLINSVHSKFFSKRPISFGELETKITTDKSNYQLLSINEEEENTENEGKAGEVEEIVNEEIITESTQNEKELADYKPSPVYKYMKIILKVIRYIVTSYYFKFVISFIGFLFVLLVLPIPIWKVEGINTF
jgi:hypothetical protein